MSIIPLIMLGAIQGLTEFLPVSSTGHLILARELFGFTTDYGLGVDAILHLATALAVAVYFRRDILALAKAAMRFALRKGIEHHERILLSALVIGTIPAAVLGYFLESAMDTLFRSAALVAWVLIAGSVLFIIAEYVGKRYTNQHGISVWRGFAIGCFQAFALIPGLSRSGATISGGLLLGLSREDAARFAFLLSFPIILGAGLKKILELESAGVLAADWLPLVLGGLAAFTTGMLAIHYLLRYLKNHTLLVFVLYRVALAAVVLTIF